jgi:hypothetical protein
MEVIPYGDGRTTPDYFDPEILDILQRKSDTFREIFDMPKDGGIGRERVENPGTRHILSSVWPND